MSGIIEPLDLPGKNPVGAIGPEVCKSLHKPDVAILKLPANPSRPVPKTTQYTTFTGARFCCDHPTCPVKGYIYPGKDRIGTCQNCGANCKNCKIR